MQKTFYVRKGQPHYQRIGGTFSIILKAHDAIPRSAITALRNERAAALAAIPPDVSRTEFDDLKTFIYKEFEQKLEECLHARRNQEHPFRDPRVAKIIIHQTKKHHGTLFYLDAICVMSNHVHLLLDCSAQIPNGWDEMKPITGYRNVHEIVRLIKGSSSYYINGFRKRTRSVWSRGYYDRLIRSTKHYDQTFLYILNNPVKAGVVKDWRDYPFTYTSDRTMLE